MRELVLRPSMHCCAKYPDPLPRSFPPGPDQLLKARVVSLLSRDFREIRTLGFRE